MSHLVETGRTYSREEFFRWVESQPRGRYERMAGKIVTMAPERGAHLRAKAAVWLALRQAIAEAGINCQALPDGATVSAGDDDYEPDAMVNCGAAMADDAFMAPNPVVVVEVLSPSTQATDTGSKLAGYFAVPSIQHYLIVHPIRRLVIHHRRASNAEDNRIETRIVAAGDIRLDPPGLTLSLARIYE